MTSVKLLVGVILFWILLGGFLQLFDLGNQAKGFTSSSVDFNEGLEVNSGNVLIDLFTFDVTYLPESFSILLTFISSTLFIIAIIGVIRGI